MAAERTPSRRRQCIFHRTLMKSPFGQFYSKRRRSSSSSSSYDVGHIDTSQQPREKWSPLDPSIATLSQQQPRPGDNGGSSEPPNTEEPPHNPHETQDENVFLEHVLMVNQELAPPNCMDQHGHHSMDSHGVCLDVIGQQEADSDYASVSHTGDECPPHVVSPPSPSVSSMETDMGIDPETGERALE